MARTTLSHSIRVFVIAFLLNVIWEMAQMPLYEGMSIRSLGSWLACMQAAIGDGVITVAIWAGGATLYGCRNWVMGPTVPRVVYLIAVGAGIAIAIETVSLAAGRWTYSAIMPVAPWSGIGVSPLIQLILLPGVAAALASLRSKRDT